MLPAPLSFTRHEQFMERISTRALRDMSTILNDFRFRAERSFLKERIEGVNSQEVPYGYPRSIRVDAYEYREDGTLCVYDLKTGKAGLPDRRADILASAIKLGFNPVRRIIVMEVRPRQ